MFRELLNQSGSIFIQLDDKEIDYLKIMLDEIFGRNNFVSRITIEARAPSAFSTVNSGVFKSSEYILWYAKDKSKMMNNTLRTERAPDYAYDKWIEYHDKPIDDWVLKPLQKVFESKNKSISNKPQTQLKKFNEFIVNNSERIVRLASISDTKAGAETVSLKKQSLKCPNQIFVLHRKKYDDIYILNGQQILFYSKNISEIDGVKCATTLLTNIWKDIAWEGIANEGKVVFNKGKKPEKLIKRCFELTTNEGDLVLDSFLGSGTTAAVAHKMKRRYIGIEIGDHAVTHCQPRLKKVVDGEQGGISKAVNWQGGGGFRFCRLGAEVFDVYGGLNPEIKFADLAAHVWYLETGQPINRNADTPFLGQHNNTAYYLLYNGILGDKTPQGGNVLTSQILKSLPQMDDHNAEQVVIYGESCRLGEQLLKQAGIMFKQIPYDVAAL